MLVATLRVLPLAGAQSRTPPPDYPARIAAQNPYLPAPVCSVRLLGGNSVPFRQMPDGLHLTLPATTTQIVLALRTSC